MADILKVKTVGFFSDLDERTLNSLAAALREERFKDGQIIFSENDIGDELYFISSGDVEIMKAVNKKEGLSQLLSSLGQGDFFGEMALFDKGRRSATVRAKGDTVLLKLSREDFQQILMNDAPIGVNILGRMLLGASKRLRETDVGYVTIYETGRLLASEKNMDTLLSGVLTKVTEVVPGCGRGFIALWNEFSEMFEVKSFSGFSPTQVELKKNDAVIKWLKEKKQSLTVDDAARAPFSDKTALPEYCGRSFFVQPFVHRDELLGFLFLSNRSEAIGISRGQINLLSGIASQVAPAIANAKKIAEDENRRRLQQARIRGSKAS